MAKRKIEDYLFADAYIGSLNRNLLSRKDMARLAACRDMDSAGSVLAEFGYEDAKKIENDDIEEFIQNEKRKLFDMVYETIPDRNELAFFLFPNDYHNVKVCLKAEFLGIRPPENMLASTGNIEPAKLVEMIRHREYAFMSDHMKKAISKAVSLFGRRKDPQVIDLILDRACYADMLEEAEKSGDEFIRDLVVLQIDLLNLKTFMRLRHLNKPWSFFGKVFLNGGNISKSFFISIYEESFDQAAEKLAPYGLKDVMAEGGKVLNETGDFARFENMADDRVMEYNKNAKYMSFGIAPIAAYKYAKETELDNLRIILTGIIIGSEAENIIERLREPYV